jgi:hypothetical protein
MFRAFAGSNELWVVRLTKSAMLLTIQNFSRGTTGLFGSILSSKLLIFPTTLHVPHPNLPPEHIPNRRFRDVQHSNAALAGGYQTLHAQAAEEQLAARVRLAQQLPMSIFAAIKLIYNNSGLLPSALSFIKQSVEEIVRKAPELFVSGINTSIP